MRRYTADLLIFHGVRAIDPSRQLDEKIDVVIERGVITRLGPNAAGNIASSSVARVIEGRSRWLVPAFIDLHAHLREPGQEYKEDILTGLSAAAAGGYAHVCAMPNTRPVNDNRAITQMMIGRARAVGGPVLHPIGAITKGLEGKELAEMGDMKDAGAVAVSDDGRCVVQSAVMRRAMEYARTFDLAVIQHAEDHALTEGAQMHEGAVSTKLGLRGWPRAAEETIVARDIILAETTGTRYHVAHVSSIGTVRLIREAKARGLPVTAEVTPHHLLLTEQALLGYDTSCKVNPPLRTEEDRAALVAALADGTIDVIATDHAPHAPLEKNCEFEAAASGMVGLETCVPLLLELVRSHEIALPRLIDALTVAPARVARIAAHGLAEGVSAELVLIDPERRQTIDPAKLASKSKNTPFLGRQILGAVELTMCEGAVIFEARDEL
jgi:dihydroorotase